MKKSNLLLIVSLILATFSCSKDDDPSKKELLCGKNWKLVAETISPAIDFNGTLITDLFAQMDDCNKDDISTFNTNGNFTFEEGATKCNPTDPQVFDTGTWTFNSDETIIVLTSNVGGIVNAKIQELKSNKLVVTYEETYDVKYTITDTYEKQ